MWRRRKEPEDDGFLVEIGGDDVRVRLRRDGRARRFTLRLPSNGGDPVVTVPKRTSARAARQFVEKERAWLAARLKRRPDAVPFADGAVIPLRGEPHQIRHEDRRRGTVWRTETEPMAMLHVAGGIEHLPRRLADYLKREAHADLHAAVAQHTETLGVKAAAIRVRDTTSRWGSCSSTGTLNFSWRLVLAPPHVLDYVAAHEVAHLKEMNHSPAFWRLVHGLCDDTETARAWLKQYGAQLHMVGAAG